MDAKTRLRKSEWPKKAHFCHLYLERALETTGKETTEWPDNAGEDGHEDGVDEEGVDGHRRLHPELNEKCEVSSG